MLKLMSQLMHVYSAQKHNDWLKLATWNSHKNKEPINICIIPKFNVHQIKQQIIYSS